MLLGQVPFGGGGLETSEADLTKKLLNSVDYTESLIFLRVVYTSNFNDFIFLILLNQCLHF